MTQHTLFAEDKPAWSDDTLPTEFYAAAADLEFGNEALGRALEGGWDLAVMLRWHNGKLKNGNVTLV